MALNTLLPSMFQNYFTKMQDVQLYMVVIPEHVASYRYNVPERTIEGFH